MEATRDPESLSKPGGQWGNLLAGDPKLLASESEGVLVVGSVGSMSVLSTATGSDISKKTDLSSSEDLVISSELVSGFSVASLTGLGHGLELFSALDEGGFRVQWSRAWGSLRWGQLGIQHKGFLESVSNVPFSPSEVLNDADTFLEAAMMVGEYF